jgi:hypothetical protein
MSEGAVRRGGPHGEELAHLRPSRRVSAVCVGLGAAFFVLGWVLAFLAAPDLVDFFYQPHVLAVVHSFTLGWISLTMIGVLYQFVPALTKQAVPWRGASGVPVALFAIGTCGMIPHFWIGHLEGMSWSADMVLAGVVLFAAQMLPPLVRAWRWGDATIIGIFAAVCWLLATALLGGLYAFDKIHPFLGGSVLSNIAAHAHLGLVGWITLTICAVSYRMVVAFLAPAETLASSARGQILCLAATAPLLALALLLRSTLAIVPALAIVASLVWYALILARLARSRRAVVDWSLRHVAAAMAHLGVAAVLGLSLFAVGADSEEGGRIAAAYGILLLVGWISNYIVGVANRMAPALIGFGPGELMPPRSAAAIFWLLNGGATAMAVAVLAGDAPALRAAMLAPTLAAALFVVALARRGWSHARA